MTSICCPKSIKGLAIRVTRADVCGTPEPETTANSRIATNGFVSLTLNPNVETGEEISVKLADGTLCVEDNDPDLLKNFEIEMLTCGVPVPLLEMLLGVALLTNGDGDVVGGVFPSKATQAADATTQTRQLEVWSKNKDASACAVGESPLPFVQWLLPLTRNWQLGGSLEFSISNLEVTLTGRGEEASGWEPSVESEWTEDMVTAIQAGGPLAWQCVETLPDTDACGYVPAASGS